MNGLAAMLSPHNEESATVYRKQHVHRLPRPPDYFLEPAPQQITITKMFGLSLDPEARWEVVPSTEPPIAKGQRGRRNRSRTNSGRYFTGSVP